MDNGIKNIAVTVVFFTFIFAFMLANIILPDLDISITERRRLAAIPTYSSKKLFNGEFFEEFEKYSLDQFVLRDVFRGAKIFSVFHLFNQKDYNNIYIIGKSINKMEYPLNENSIMNAANKLNEIYDKYLRGMNVSYSIIPDKNYYVARENGYLSMDYGKMMDIMTSNVEDIKYVDLFDLLCIEDYYNTDIHWKQERITGAADRLLEEMGNEFRVGDMLYEKKSLYPFYGGHLGRVGFGIQPDSLVYLTNELLEEAVVYDYELNERGDVYIPEKFGGTDPYDVFLSGAKPLLTIENPFYSGDKELIIFRDSFGSSIAPLLVAGYSKVTLIDIRYISSNILESYIAFSQEQDILFLYSTLVLNNSYMLK